VPAVFWWAGAVSMFNALSSLGFSLVALIDASLDGTGRAHGVALYATGRCLSLLVGTASVVALRSRAGLLALGFTLVLVQLLDAAVGEGAVKVVGPLVLAALTALACYRLWRSADPARLAE